VTYTVHESFLTIQGEGAHAGRVAVFCRFAGCNLWTGREQDRASAVCKFCDTEFRGGTKYKTAGELAKRLLDLWPTMDLPRFVVLTGGEPLLQVDAELLEALHWAGFYVAVETNGTVCRPSGIDWLCVSPKAGTQLAIRGADETKVVYPQDGIDLTTFESYPWGRRSIQPMDGPDLEANTAAAVAYCLEHPSWRLSVQTHKVIGVR
jgi:7-carboxy-7-deazaguanine synthase (Cx14CxxC type)